MLSFDILTFLFWVLVSTFIPGAILGFALFKSFNNIEKKIMGFAVAFISLPLIPFLLNLLLGIKYSYELALLSVAIIYIISIALFVYNKSYKEIRLPKMDRELAITVALILILVLSYLVRIGSYSPIFQELDPYFYTYSAQQLITLGENPLDDQTAWYPEMNVNHRVIPALSYTEAIWYSLYTGGGEYDNLLMAVIAGMYPPIAAVLAVFFIYLLISVIGTRELGVLTAGIASFVPIFIYKLSAGEMEVQPYAFFALMFLYAMYAIMITRKDMKFAVLAGLGFAAVSLGSSSQLLALASLMIFVVLQSVFYYLKNKDLEFLIKSNAVIFIIGPLLGSFIKNFFIAGSITLSIAAPFLLVLILAALLYYLGKNVPSRDTQYMILATVAILALVLFVFTPLGDVVKKIGSSGFGFASFNAPLDRTIAEQGLASGGLEPQLGFISFTPDPNNVIELVSYAAFLPFTIIANIVLTITVSLLNAFLGTSVDFIDRANSFSMLIIVLFWAALSYSLYKMYRKDEDDLPLLFLAIIMPPFLVGILKAKFTIYAGVMLALAVGYLLSVFSKIEFKIPGLNINSNMLMLILGALLLVGQFTYNGLAINLAYGSFIPLYQNDPMALQEKFQAICEDTFDPTICAAADDPVGYAGRGINYQYDQKLCLLSVFTDYTYLSSGMAPADQRTIAYFRCQRISDYWIDSMEWIKKNTEPDARIISWWDYGHWENFFGQRNAVIRNDHKNKEMIGAVANYYLDATPQELISYMKSHDSEYALFDVELVSSGNMLGGKYGALNYLSCAWNNETTVANSPGTSLCEAEHLWEIIYVSQSPCTVSALSDKTGLTAYKIYANGVYRPYYPNDCVSPSDQAVVSGCQNAIQAVPTYCVAEAMLANGQPATATYYLDEKYPNGDLKLNKAILQFPFSLPNSVHMGPATGVTLLYTEDPVWLENGEIKSGYEDRKGKFYDSNLYNAIFTESLEGFDFVYATDQIKIFKIAE